jgi:hypothetical protein
MRELNWRLSAALVVAAFCGGLAANCGDDTGSAGSSSGAVTVQGWGAGAMPLSGPAVCRATRTDLLISPDRPAVEQVIKYAGGLVVEREIFDLLIDPSDAAVTQQYFYDDRGRLTRVETTDILIDRDVPATIDEFEYECESEEPRFFSGG